MKDFQLFKDKNVLVTGHTGFKGSWLSIWLIELGANVIGYSLDPKTDEDNFVVTALSRRMVDIRGDIRDYPSLQKVFEQYRPEIVFHLAAQPLVRESYTNPKETYEVNVNGTINVLQCVKQTNETKVPIFVTSDKCYENNEQRKGYKETDPIGGYDPYSSSKGCAELIISAWRRSFFHGNDGNGHQKSIASVRAGNVIGGGDWAKDRIIPDCIRNIKANRPIKIRYPKAIRPWQHVLEPLGGYLLLGSKMLENPLPFADAWNFGPEETSFVTVEDLVQKVINMLGEGKIELSMDETLHEAKMLTLNIDKASALLGWQPHLSLDKSLQLTVEWYNNYKNSDVYEICREQIHMYQAILEKEQSS